MEKQAVKLCLKPGAVLAQSDAATGLTLAGKTRWAKNDAQRKLLRALARRPLAVEALCGTPGAPPEESFAPLDVASFILDFGDYLEN